MIEQLLPVGEVKGVSAFLGEVPVSELITGNALASAIGLTAGTAQNSNEPWLHFELDGRTLFVAKKPYRRSISWEQINLCGAVHGENIIIINNSTYMVRLLKGINTSIAIPTTDSYDSAATWGSEWNRLFYPLVTPIGAKPRRSNEGIVFGSAADYITTDLGITGNSIGSSTICQDRQGSFIINRGFDGVTHGSVISPVYVSANTGWRPCLELVE